VVSHPGINQTKGQQLILLHPGARWESKRWMPEKFTVLIQSIIERKDFFPVIIGGPEDLPIGQQIITSLTQPPLNWIAKTNLKELIALVEMSDVLISHDSGPMHLAVAIGTPVIAIFGPSDPGYSGPHNPKDVVIRTGISCIPCFKTICPGLGNVCLNEITPQQVLQALEELLGGSSVC
jgi:ADP-heptose:LPS heptosyltransferase